MLNKIEKMIYIITFLIIGIGIVAILVLKFQSHSILNDKEDVEAYLEETFKDKDFEIGERIELDEKVCDEIGYKWLVKSNKSGISFDVFEQAFYHDTKCTRGINDSYNEKSRDFFYQNENIESDNKYHYILYPYNYNSNEELANRIYELINKYYLKSKPFSIRLIIKMGDNNVAVMPEDINSPEDIINNYLS